MAVGGGADVVIRGKECVSRIEDKVVAATASCSSSSAQPLDRAAPFTADAHAYTVPVSAPFLMLHEAVFHGGLLSFLGCNIVTSS